MKPITGRMTSATSATNLATGPETARPSEVVVAVDALVGTAAVVLGRAVPSSDLQCMEFKLLILLVMDNNLKDAAIRPDALERTEARRHHDAPHAWAECPRRAS